MFWCLVRLSTGALCGGLYANPLEMAIQSAVACSEAKMHNPHLTQGLNICTYNLDQKPEAVYIIC